MSNESTIQNGATVYDEDDTKLGVITGSTSDGFTVSIADEVEYIEETNQAGTSDSEPTSAGEESHEIDLQEHDPGQEFGEGYIMWRCDDCGEMGELEDGLPEECPSCGSSEVYKFKED
jgi:rubrerythrin